MMSEEVERDADLEPEANIPDEEREKNEPEDAEGEVADALRHNAGGGYGGWDHVANENLKNADVEPGKEFSAKLQRIPGMRLGLECVEFEGELVVQGIIEGMVTEEWNQQNPFQAIQVGDVVREVNAIRGDVKTMLSELRKALVLSLKLEHCSRSVPQQEEPPLKNFKRTGGNLLRYHQRLQLEAAIMDQAHAIAAISRRHQRADLEPKVWEAASNWNLENFMLFEEVPFLAAFGYAAQDKVTWEEGKRMPSITMDLDEHFEQAGCTWYVIKCQLEVPTNGAEAETLTWEAPRRLHHLRTELHDRLWLMEEGFYKRIFKDTPFARHMSLPGTTARLKTWLGRLTEAINQKEVPPMAAAITLLFLHAPAPSDEQELPERPVEDLKPPRPSQIMAI